MTPAGTWFTDRLKYLKTQKVFDILGSFFRAIPEFQWVGWIGRKSHKLHKKGSSKEFVGYIALLKKFYRIHLFFTSIGGDIP